MTKEIFKELVVSEEDLLSDAVAKAKGLLAIEEKSGRVILRVPKDSLTARDMIGLLLIGRYFSNQMEKAKSANMSLSELSTAGGVDNQTASARLHELVNSGWVNRIGRGEFVVNPYLMNAFLDEIVISRTKPSLSPVTTPSPTTPSDRELRPADAGSFPDVGRSPSLTEAILQLLGTSWGKTPRDWREIHQALKHNAMHFSVGSVTGTLTLLTQSHRVRRIKEGRSYKYLLPSGA